MDPPGHTVFLYLQELNRTELQKQAKLYGIKANQKSEVLRQELQRILSKKDIIKSPTQSGIVNEEETRDEEVVILVKEEKTVDVDGSIVEDSQDEEQIKIVEKGIVTQEKKNAVELTVAQGDKESEQPDSSNVSNEEVVKVEEPKVEAVSSQQQDSTVGNQDESAPEHEMESKYDSAWMEGEGKEDGEVERENQEEDGPMDVAEYEMENEESTDVPPQVVIVNTDSNEMTDLADESIASPTTAAKEMFRSKLPSGPVSKKTRNVLGERPMNTKSSNYTTKLGKPQRNFQPSSLSKIIRTKNSTTRPAQSNTTRNPTLATQTNPKPKQMALSRRNELQLQKFIERQNRGRKKREEQLQRAEFANLVRSPGRA